MQLPKMPSFSLKGRTALIVGASSGIGTACAVALAEHGAKVTLAARRKDKLEPPAWQVISGVLPPHRRNSVHR